MKWCMLALLALVLLRSGPARGENPSDEYDRQINEPAEKLRNPSTTLGDRREAVDKLGRLGSAVWHIVGDLQRALHDPDELIRVKAAEALRELGPSAHEAVPDLIKALKEDSSEDVRAKAAHAIADILVHWRCCVQEETVAVATLTQALKDKSRKVRAMAAGVLGAFGAGAKSAVPALVEALGEKDARDEPGFKDLAGFRVCLAAADSLGEIGPEARAAIPTLLDLVKKKKDDLHLQRSAIAALGSIGDHDEKVVPALLAAAENERLRGAAVIALGKMGPKRAKEVLPTILKALDVRAIRDKEYADLVQACAIHGLGELGTEAKATIPRIEAILEDPGTGLNARNAAEKALKDLHR